MDAYFGREVRDEVDPFSLDQGWKRAPERNDPVKRVEEGRKLEGQKLIAGATKLLRSEIQKLARAEFHEALAELDRARELRASKLVEEAKRRAGERGGGPLPKFSNLVDYSSSYAKTYESYLSKKCKHYNDMRYIPACEHSFGDPAYQLRGFSGDEVLRALRSVFGRFPDAPTPFQWKVFEAMLCAAKALIYGQEYDNDPNWVLERNGWIEDNDLVAVLTGRKTGKSTGLSMSHLAFMMVIQGYRGCNASRTVEQAIIIVDLGRQLVVRHPDLRAQGMRIDQSRARYLSIKKTNNTISSLECKCGDGNVSVSLIFLSFVFFFERAVGRSLEGTAQRIFDIVLRW